VVKQDLQEVLEIWDKPVLPVLQELKDQREQPELREQPDRQEQVASQGQQELPE